MVPKKESKNLDKKFYAEIEIPSGINAQISDEYITLTKNGDEIKRKLTPEIDISIKENKIIIKANKNTRREKKVLGSYKAHLNNMIKGFNEPFVYKLQAVSVHFPMTLKIEKGSNELVIKNFLGEKKDRVIKLLPGVSVDIVKDVIEIKTSDIEKGGLIASKIEKGTKIRNRDRRVFQDGIYIIEKPGRSYL